MSEQKWSRANSLDFIQQKEVRRRGKELPSCCSDLIAQSEQQLRRWRTSHKLSLLETSADVEHLLEDHVWILYDHIWIPFDFCAILKAAELTKDRGTLFRGGDEE